MGASVRVIITKYEFDWGSSDPTPGIDKNCFSFTFDSLINVTMSGQYRFKLISDGKSQFKFNYKMLIDKSGIGWSLSENRFLFEKEKESIQ